MSEYNNGFAINTRLSKEMYDWIRQRAKIDQVSMGHVIRQALRNMIDEKKPNKVKRKLSHGRI